MKLTKLALSLLAGLGTGFATVPCAAQVSLSNLPNCFDSNYDAERQLFTLKNAAANAVNQQCLLTVQPRGEAASASRLTAGSYTVSLANGGGGGAGGTREVGGGGGGGGGGAGAKETQATVDLAEGIYKLTIGAGGPGGSACVPGMPGSGSGSGALAFDGGPGWLGSPSNIVRVATGDLVMGVPGADSYARPTRGQNERMAGKKRDGHGGSGPGQASGGDGGHAKTTYIAEAKAAAGESKSGAEHSAAGGAPGFEPGTVKHPKDTGGGGGGGGATSLADGGGGAGETLTHKVLSPVRGSLGSGGGGGEGNSGGCDAGARGGHGFIALRRI